MSAGRAGSVAARSNGSPALTIPRPAVHNAPCEVGLVFPECTKAMVTLSVCLETVFTGLPVEQRIERISNAGYEAVEFWHPEGTWDGNAIRFDCPKSAPSIRRACSEHGVRLNDFSFHGWDGSLGGSPVRGGNPEGYLDQIRRMVSFANEAGCEHGIVLSGMSDPSLSRERMRSHLEEALASAVSIAAEGRITLLLEPLNTLVDHPGYYLDSSREGIEIVRTINSPHLKLLFDVYHMQVMEGNLLSTIEKNLDVIGHFHSAGVPGRGELYGTEVNYPEIVRRLDELGYDGCFGLEYFPSVEDHDESLRRIRSYLHGDKD